MTRCVADTNIVVYYLNQVGGDDFRRRFDEIIQEGRSYFGYHPHRCAQLAWICRCFFPSDDLPKLCYQPFARNP